MKPLLEKNRLSLAAVGTGAGRVADGLALISAVSAERSGRRDFVRSIIDAAAVFKRRQLSARCRVVGVVRSIATPR